MPTNSNIVMRQIFTIIVTIFEFIHDNICIIFGYARIDKNIFIVKCLRFLNVLQNGDNIFEIINS